MIKKILTSFFVVTLLFCSFAIYKANAASVDGPGGTARLDYLTSSKQLSWSVKPATKYAYEFDGTISFGGGARKSWNKYLVGFGINGSSSSGLVNAPGTGSCTATLTGTAYAINGLSFKVLPGVECPYSK